ncbi:MerR family transcriptional regulator [Cellulomonas chengniuliangii]|uniref:MerR family transcriptional regulator n=1 Tax=Cellulomonas chengniuliangii TaxID=2968084 RepID=UPI001D0E3D27|nr:MerR family transcriptional regulator [Cellulomonas chengniuliangii]MCC2318113.1 MerR family transcriptional regulator [Cellulomonas chengniuliangii]
MPGRGPRPERDETWTIDEVARLSGTTSRALRHYDAIGVLPPRGTAAGGRRLYGRAELVRLQQILVLRELGVDLATIGDLLRAEDADSPEAARRARLDLLREHRERLLAESDRFARLAATVTSTLESLEGGSPMEARDLYAGFDNSQYDAEARERWGDAAVDLSNDSWTRLGEDGQARHLAEQDAVSRGLAEFLAAGVPVDDDRVQALVARHYAGICVSWTPGRESYAGLGDMYVEDARFTAVYDAYAPGLAVYLRDAMRVYAQAVLR